MGRPVTDWPIPLPAEDSDMGAGQEDERHTSGISLRDCLWHPDEQSLIFMTGSNSETEVHVTSADLDELRRVLAPGGYLDSLDAAIRRVHGQTWNDKGSQSATLSGLVTARNLFTHPGERRTYIDGLREALSVPPAQDCPGC
jgi:hypothetical protein